MSDTVEDSCRTAIDSNANTGCARNRVRSDKRFFLSCHAERSEAPAERNRSTHAGRRHLRRVEAFPPRRPSSRPSSEQFKIELPASVGVLLLRSVMKAVRGDCIVAPSNRRASRQFPFYHDHLAALPRQQLCAGLFIGRIDESMRQALRAGS